MEKVFSNQAHRPLCCSPSVTKDLCRRSQTPNKVPKVTCRVLVYSARLLGMQVCAWPIEKGDVLEAEQCLVFAVT